MPIAVHDRAQVELRLILAGLGSGALLAALALAGFAALVSGWSGYRRRALLARVGRRAYFACFAALALATATLLAGFLTHDYAIAYVALHSDSHTAGPLLAAAFYSGQEGSLLYWTLVLTGIGAVSLAGQGGERLPAYATAVLATLSAFFLTLLVFVASPFTLLGFAVADGAGLNPLLRDGGMLVHPPFLLAGFASFAVPFAFATAALLAGRVDPAWINHTRRLALLAWGLQGTGLLLGMWWAYHVLGWGGYFGWDPVENVALLPWLASTAYIHSAQVQERRGLFGAWNFALVILAFLLAVFGTFVVRSGVIESVHSFAVSAIGPWFLAFLGVALIFSALLLAIRAPLMRSSGRLQAPVSREGAFLLQNLLLVGAGFAILWGTLLPLTSRLWSADAEVVGPSFYERSAVPVFGLLLGLLAFGPLLPWRGGRSWLRRARWPGLAGAGMLAALLGAGVLDPRALIALPLVAAGLATCLLEFVAVRFSVARILRDRRRLAAYVAHAGILLAAAGFAGSHVWQQEREVVLAPGDSVSVGRYSLTLDSIDGWNNTSAAVLTTSSGQTLLAGRTVYPDFGGQSTSQVAIRSTPLEDLYVVLSGTQDGRATLLVFVNPLVSWIWAGGALLILGTLAGALPGRRRPEPAPRRLTVPAWEPAS